MKQSKNNLTIIRAGSNLCPFLIYKFSKKERTFFTEERFLPKILVELGFYPSIGEIRRNKPELCVNLDEVDFIPNLKVRKKMFVSILVGE